MRNETPGGVRLGMCWSRLGVTCVNDRRANVSRPRLTSGRFCRLQWMLLGLATVFCPVDSKRRALLREEQ